MLLFVLFRSCVLGKRIFNTGVFPIYIRVPLLIAGVMVFWIIFKYGFSLSKRLSDSSAIMCSGFLFIFMIAIFGILMTEVRLVPLTDSHSLLDQALTFAKSGQSHIDNTSVYRNYFSKYSNNYLLTISLAQYFKFLSSIGIKDMFIGAYFLNAVTLMLGAFFTWLVAVKFKGAKTGLKVLMFFALNPIYYLFMFWVYSNTLSLPFMMGLMLLGVTLCENDDIVHRMACAILLGIVTALAYSIRPTAVFPLLAIAIAWMIWGIHSFFQKLIAEKLTQNFGKWLGIRIGSWLIVLVIFGATLFSCQNYINSKCDNYFATVKSGNYPLTHWLMMGSHDNGEYTSEDDWFTNSTAPEKKQEATWNETVNNYKTLGPLNSVKLWLKKTSTVWSDGYFEMDLRLKQTTKYTPLFKYIGGSYRTVLNLYCQCFWIAILSMSVLNVLIKLIKRKIDSFTFINFVTILGGIVFYFFWEVKPAYAIPFVPFFFILAGDMDNLFFWKKKSVEDSDVQILEPAYTQTRWYNLMVRFISFLQVAALVVSYATAIILLQNTAISQVNGSVYDNYSIRCCGNTWMKEIELDDGKALVQSFYPGNKFNEISFCVCENLSIEDKVPVAGLTKALALTASIEQSVGIFSYDKYEVVLSDSDSDVVYSTSLNSLDITEDDTITIHLPHELPASTDEGYILTLRKTRMSNEEFNEYIFKCGDNILALDECYINLITRKGITLDSYKGECSVNGKAQCTDFHMQVNYVPSQK